MVEWSTHPLCQPGATAVGRSLSGVHISNNPSESSKWEFNAAFGDGAEGASLAFPDPAWMPGAAGASWSGTCFMGSSAKAIYALARNHGYRVVGVVDGLDLLLVRADLWPWPGLALSSDPLVTRGSPGDSKGKQKPGGQPSAPGGKRRSTGSEGGRIHGCL